MKRLATDAFKCGVAAVDSYECIRKCIDVSPTSVTFSAAGQSAEYALGENSKVIMIAIGKASLSMAKAAEEQLGERITRGIVLAPVGSDLSDYSSLKSTIRLGAENNLPDADSVAATREALDLIENEDDEDAIFLFMIAGGGSALFCQPHKVSLEEKLDTIKALVRKGATIQQLNTIRQALSEVKGGKTLEHIKKGKVVTLILSDVIGDPLHLIASGPTAPPPSLSSAVIISSLTVHSVLEDLEPDLPEHVREVLASPETVDLQNICKDVINLIVASNTIALEAAEARLKEEGYTTTLVTTRLCGWGTERGREFASVIQKSDSVAKAKAELTEFHPNLERISLPEECTKVAFIFGGETTIYIRGNGIGGRNQEMVLACLDQLVSKAEAVPCRFAFLSCGTDGQDGPTDAAGAVISNEDLENLTDEERAEIRARLKNNDSYNLWNTFRSGESHLKIGKTGTNVMDVQLLLLDFEKKE